MTTWLEGDHSFFLGSQAFILDEDRETASSWASKYVQPNAAHRFILGRYVEADRANNNRQKFSLEGLQMARPTIAHAPMNMNHHAKHVVGAYVATDLIYPTQTAGADEHVNTYAPTGDEAVPNMATCEKCGEIYDETINAICPHCLGKGEVIAPEIEGAKAALEVADTLNPYIEALGVFWKHYFPDEWAAVEAAHQEGRLYYSMECVPSQIQCTGDGGCGETFEYAGRISNTYCAHLNETASDKYLIEPHFTAGAILIPPVRPGWSNANVHSLVAKHAQLAEQIYDNVASDMSHLDPRAWEALMAELLTLSSR